MVGPRCDHLLQFFRPHAGISSCRGRGRHTIAEKQVAWECYRLNGADEHDEWKRVLSACFELPGPYLFDATTHHLRVWDPRRPSVRAPGSEVVCRDGFHIERVAFGATDDATDIGISPARLAFEPGSRLPSKLPANVLFSKGHQPPVLRNGEMIAQIHPLVEFLNAHLGDNRLEPRTDYTVHNSGSAVAYLFADTSVPLTSLLAGSGFRINLLNMVKSARAKEPVPVHLGVLPTEPHLEQPGLQAGQEIARILSGWGCQTVLAILRDEARVNRFLADQSRGKAVILVPLRGKKGEPPPEHSMAWLKALNERNAAFQLCSTESNLAYSRHGLATVILGKAGGTLFRAEPEAVAGYREAWFVGLDLGLGGKHTGKVVAIVLTDSNGRLIAHWRARKGNDETLSVETLSEGLAWVVNEAEARRPGQHYYLIRDGVRPHNESLELYLRAMAGCEFTLIEYAKSGVPFMHREGTQPEPGTTILPANSRWAALYPCQAPQRGVFTTPAKFAVPINPRNHTLSEVASVLTALCHAATLSFEASRLPAPIQWADGLAEISYSNLQFSGWAHVPRQLIPVRTTR